MQGYTSYGGVWKSSWEHILPSVAILILVTLISSAITLLAVSVGSPESPDNGPCVAAIVGLERSYSLTGEV
jgi:hypothetical protein